MARALIPSRGLKYPVLRQRELPKREIHGPRADTLVLEVRANEDSPEVVLSNCAWKYDETAHYLIIDGDFIVPALSHHSSLPVGRLVSRRAPYSAVAYRSAVVNVILEGAPRRPSQLLCITGLGSHKAYHRRFNVTVDSRFRQTFRERLRIVRFG